MLNFHFYLSKSIVRSKVNIYQNNKYCYTVGLIVTAWKVPKYGVFFGPYLPAFGMNAGKYGPENTPYLDTFHTVCKCLVFDLLEV